MAMPSQTDIELPLLLELERLGGRVRKGEELYSRVRSHFSDLTQEDLQRTRESTGANLWENTVDFVRLALRTKGEINGGERGIWEITDSGRRRLRMELHGYGLVESAVEGFVKSSQTFLQALGPRWQPKISRPQPRQEKRAGVVVTPPPPPQQPPPREPEGWTDISAQLLDRLLQLSPAEFENLVGKFLEANGFQEVRVTGRSHDGGIDGDCVVPFINVKIAFQAKRFRLENTVGTQLMQQFKGSVGAYERGIFITTSSFTAGAREIAEQPGVRILLIDGQELVVNMVKKGLGIKTVPVTNKDVDEDFFQTLGS